MWVRCRINNAPNDSYNYRGSKKLISNTNLFEQKHLMGKCGRNKGEERKKNIKYVFFKSQVGQGSSFKEPLSSKTRCD